MNKFISLLASLVLLSGCGGNTTQEAGTDVNAACVLLSNPDESRVGVLMIIGAAEANPEIVTAGRGNPFNYINSTIREFKFPGVKDGLEASDIKNKFADALDTFATAYLGDNKAFQLEASSNLTKVTQELRDRCVTLGFKFTDDN